MDSKDAAKIIVAGIGLTILFIGYLAISTYTTFRENEVSRFRMTQMNGCWEAENGSVVIDINREMGPNQASYFSKNLTVFGEGQVIGNRLIICGADRYTRRDSQVFLDFDQLPDGNTKEVTINHTRFLRHSTRCPDLGSINIQCRIPR